MAEPLVIQRLGPDGQIWLVCQGDAAATVMPAWVETARNTFDAHAEVATLSIVSSTGGAADAVDGELIHATRAALPVLFINGRIGELIGLSSLQPAHAALASVVERASLRGLSHYWLVADAASPATEVPEGRGGVPAVVGRAPGARSERPLSVGIDASWLLGGESGAQVFTIALLRALAERSGIARIVLLSDSGGVPASLQDIASVSGRTWQAAMADPQKLDVLHRPYQPNQDTPLELYRRIANAVVITVLDFIAYDNAAYHESDEHWSEYRAAFDERVCGADQVVGISGDVTARLQRQFAHRLAMPASAVLGGADHISTSVPLPAECPPGVSAPFTVVLGNDFAHKNRDFAVRVFAEMCARGYEGRLVLAGFHLDRGSSFGTELGGAGAVAERVVRLGAVSPAQKRYLLAEADVVLYPTSSEGFGLVPFEAAALGTPCAFVRFGPLKETMPDVRAASAWTVQEFADLALGLRADPSQQVEQIRRAAEKLTWARAAGEMTDIYRRTRWDTTPWASRRPMPAPPGTADTIQKVLRQQTRRVSRKLRRLAGASQGNA